MSKLLSWFSRILGVKYGKMQYKQHVMSETANVNFTAITHDWEKSKHLYDILKRKCHPDLYIGEQNEVATHLFQMLMEKKYDYKELLKIKELAVKDLGASFND